MSILKIQESIVLRTIFSLILIFPLYLQAQVEADLTGAATVLPEHQALFHRYAAQLGRGAAIWNGPEYIGGDPRIFGHPFYQTKNFQHGYIIYQGYKYDSLLLSFDVQTDQLVLVFSEEGRFFTITPDPALITSFSLLGHTFVYLTDEIDGLPGPGYYDLLYNGQARVLARRSKNTVSSKVDNYLYQYTEADKYYVWKDGKYHIIRSKAGIYDLFKDLKKPLKAYAKRQGLDFQESPETFLQELSAHIDSTIQE